MTTERVDVCIVGSGFGGAISAFRLAELYVATGHDPARIVVLERGRILAHGNHDELLEASELYREIVEKGLPDQVFLTRKPAEAKVVGL